MVVDKPLENRPSLQPPVQIDVELAYNSFVQAQALLGFLHNCDCKNATNILGSNNNKLSLLNDFLVHIIYGQKFHTIDHGIEIYSPYLKSAKFLITSITVSVENGHNSPCNCSWNKIHPPARKKL